MSGREEPMWIVKYMYTEAMLGISLYSYFYLILAKILFFFLSLMSSLQQNWRTRWQNRFCLESAVGEGGGPNNVNTSSKFENDKMKF
jgi:hypothetical protein